MKDEYDFSQAEQGKFYRPVEQLDIPIYLDKEVREFFLRQSRLQNKPLALGKTINALLKQDIEISNKISGKT